MVKEDDKCQAITPDESSEPLYSTRHGAKGGVIGLATGALVGLYTVKELFWQNQLQTVDILIGAFGVGSNMAVGGAIGMAYGSKLIRSEISNQLLDAEIAFRLYILRQ